MTETMKAIRREMAELNIKQVDMADRTCISECTISRWLNGKRTPNIDYVEKIADALGLKVVLTDKHKIRKQDINILNNRTNLGYGIVIEGNTKKIGQLLDAAIKALSQEPCRYWQNGKCNGNTEVCDDAVSRKTLLTNLYQYKISCAGRIQAAILEIEELVEKMPSVTQKSGKWVVDGSVDCYLDKVRCHCSECGKKKKFPADYDHIKQELSISYKNPEFIDNYCPNCGCRMVEPQESEVRNDKRTER